MIKDTIEDIRADLKSKRDALLIGHQNLKKDCDDWNKAIIVISLVSGLAESIKMRLELKGAGWTLLPIILSSITATMASLMKFRNFNQRMETYLQSASLLTNTLLKARNHKEVDEDLLTEYNGSLEKIETALYPNERKVFLKQASLNFDVLLRYYDKIDKVNNHEISDDSSLSSDEKIMDESKARKNPLRELPAIQSKDVLDVLEEADEDKL